MIESNEFNRIYTFLKVSERNDRVFSPLQKGETIYFHGDLNEDAFTYL